MATKAADKAAKERQKLIQDKCQAILTDLLRDEDNKYCVDCDAKGPRWASWNLGIFLCIRCAGIHRNLGVHISRVKSVNLDSWTPEQVGSILNMGNSKARAVYEANLPDNFSRPQSDSPLETFIRAKYELKKYIAKEWSETPPKPAFDIEELLRKEKENKKNKIKLTATIGGLSSNSDIQPNSIPRPNAANMTHATARPSAGSVPKPVTVPVVAAAKPSNNEPASIDLLGLDAPVPASSAEPFDFFATSSSSSTPANKPGTDKPAPSKSLEDEEKDFFSQQTGPTEEKKLTKESILSLYSSGTSTAPAMAPTTGFNPLAGLSANPTVNAPGANSLANQFAGMNVFGTAMPPMGNPAPPTMAANTNPFLAASGNSAPANLNFGAFGGLGTVPAAQQPMPAINMAWPTNTGASMNGVNNSFAMNPQANPFVNKAQAPSNLMNAFEFKPANGTSAAPAAASQPAIPAFANFSNFPTNNSSTGNSAPISKDPPTTSFW